MGQAFLKGQSGGSSLVDLEVVIGDSLPTGQEGLVFVETSIPYQTVFFDSKSPTEYLNGDIFITTTEGGDNFVKVFSSGNKNQVTIYLKNALQVVDGNFVSVNAYVFTGNWVQFSFYIPDGKTVLPTDDIVIWGRCTQKDTATPVDLSGMTIEEVVADVEILKVLFNSNNANNYMLRSTEIIQPAVLGSSVAETAIESSQYYCTNPIMTSNTTPEGVASTSSQFPDFQGTTFSPYKAFVNGTPTYPGPSWVGAIGQSEYWVKWQLDTVSVWFLNFKLIAYIQGTDFPPVKIEVQNPRNNVGISSQFMTTPGVEQNIPAISQGETSSGLRIEGIEFTYAFGITRFFGKGLTIT